jgi:hypothetical protein
MTSLPYGRIDHHRVLRQLYLLNKHICKNRYMFRRRTIHFQQPPSTLSNRYPARFSPEMLDRRRERDIRELPAELFYPFQPVI